MRDLGEPASAREIIDSAVADVREVHPLGCEPAEAQRGAHSGAFLVGEAEFQQVGVNFRDEFHEDIGESAVHPGGGEPEGARQEFCDAIDGNAAGENPDALALRAGSGVSDAWASLRAALIAEAEFVVKEGTASATDVDIAIKLAMNFPKGPLEWRKESTAA